MSKECKRREPGCPNDWREVHEQVETVPFFPAQQLTFAVCLLLHRLVDRFSSDPSGSPSFIGQPAPLLGRQPPANGDNQEPTPPAASGKRCRDRCGLRDEMAVGWW